MSRRRTAALLQRRPDTVGQPAAATDWSSSTAPTNSALPAFPAPDRAPQSSDPAQHDRAVPQGQETAAVSVPHNEYSLAQISLTPPLPALHGPSAPPFPSDAGQPDAALTLPPAGDRDAGASRWSGMPPVIQARLAVTPADDPYEAEAERMARLVTQTPDVIAQHSDAAPDSSGLALPTIQAVRQESGAGVGEVDGATETAVLGLRGSGQPLPTGERAFFEQRFGQSFDGVRVHTDAKAAQLATTLNAEAFTVGQDIAFGAGFYTPGSAEGRELLAHELTHVVQQTGGIATKRIQRTEQERAPAADAGICPVCGRVGTGTCPDCGQPFLPIQRKARTDTPDATPEPPASEQPTADATPAGTAASEAAASEAAANEAAANEAAALTDGAPAPNADPAKAGSPRAEDVGVGNPMLEAVQQSATDGPRQALTDQAQQLRAQLLGSAPPLADLAAQLASPDPAASAPDPALQERVSQVQAGRDVARGKADAATAELTGVQDVIGQLAGAPVELAPLDLPAILLEAGIAPEAADSSAIPIFRKEADTEGADAEAPPDPAALVALIEQLRSQAQGMVSSFMAGASGRVQGALALGQAVPAQLQAPVAAAQAVIMAGVQAQNATITAQFAQARAQAQSMAETQRADLEAQHSAALAAIQATTAQTSQQFERGYQQATERIEQLEQTQRQTLTQRYALADQEYRAAGTRVGQEAVGVGEQMAGEYLSGKINRDDSFLDGDLTDRRCEARAKAAREVSSQYQAGLVEEANKQAAEAQKGLPRDLETLGTVKTAALTTLEQQHRTMLEQAQASAEAAQQQAEQAKAQFMQAIEQSLQGTMQTLGAQEASQLQGLESMGQQQVAALDQAGQSTIAALQQSVTQTVAGLQSVLGSIGGALSGVQVPDPEAIGTALGGAMEQIEGGITTLQDQIAQGVAAAEQQFMQQSDQAVQTLEATAQEVAASVSELIDTLTQSFSQLQSGVSDSYRQIQEGFSTQASQLQETATTSFAQVAQGTEQTFTQINQNVDTAFDQAAPALENGLRGALDDMRAKIRAEADKAADQEQPRWKGILKIVLIIAVIVVVALVIGPFVIGAVGAAAGALGASAAAASAIGAVVGGAIVGAGTSAVIQMGSNLIDGKPVLEGVVQAMVVGAIGGALGGLGGLAGQGLVNTLRVSSGFAQGALKLGVDMAFDTVGGILGNMATGQPITLDGIVQGFLSGAAVSLSMGGLGKLGRFGQGIEGIQQRSMAAGEAFGGSIPTLRPSTGIDMPSSTPRSDSDMPSSTPRSDSDMPSSTPRKPGNDDPSTTPDKQMPHQKDLDQHAVPVDLDGATHTLRPTRIGDELQVWMCSTCGSLTGKIDGLLATISDKGPTKSLYTRLTKMRTRVQELESGLNSGSVPFNRIPAEANQIGAHLRDMSQKFPGFESQLNVGKMERPDASDYDDLAQRLGFTKTNLRSHGQPVYRSGNKYISPDIDMHNGGVWKMADSHRNLGQKTTRMGTYDQSLERIGD